MLSNGLGVIGIDFKLYLQSRYSGTHRIIYTAEKKHQHTIVWCDAQTHNKYKLLQTKQFVRVINF